MKTTLALTGLTNFAKRLHKDVCQGPKYASGLSKYFKDDSKDTKMKKILEVVLMPLQLNNLA